MKKVAIILQARMNSSRRPYKISTLFKGKPFLYWQIKRLQMNSFVDKIIVATTKEDLDDATEFIALEANARVYRGDTDDVMNRYIKAAEINDIDYIIRVCGDDPLVSPECIEDLYKKITSDKFDVVTASHNHGWMLGTSAEAFTLKAIKDAYKNSSIFEKEHVVIYFYNNQSKYKFIKISPEIVFNSLSLTVDYPEDVDNVNDVLNFFDRIDFSHNELIDALKSNALKLTHKRIDKFSI